MSIQTQIERLTEAKATLKTAIEQKGVDVPEGAPLEQYAPLVEQIAGGGAEEWQKLAEVTLEEEASQIILSSEQNPLIENKKHLLVRIRSETPFASGYVKIGFENGKEAPQITGGGNNLYMIASRVDVIGGVWASGEFKSTNNAVNAIVPAPSITVNKTGDGFSSSHFYLPYKKIRLYGSLFTLPVGTTISIWGY